MSRLSCSILLSVFLSGCAGQGLDPARFNWPFSTSGKAGAGMTAVAVERYAEFNFDWQLEGASEIMPLQVFDDAVSMWLQFAPDGAWPAVFENTVAGLRPLSYRREPPYMVLDAVYQQLELRGGHLRGSVRRPVPQAPAVIATATPTALSLAAAPVVVAAEPEYDPAPLHEAQPLTVPGVSPLALAPAEPAPAAIDFLGAPVGRYAVSPADHTMRQALERWARAGNWTFSAEHWAVDVDIPLVGEASFESDFKSAVRELLAATEMGDRPLQPCFYSNRVLRVVPYAQPCDRRGGSRAVS